MNGSISHDASDESMRSEEHTSELQSRLHLVCRLLLEKKKTTYKYKPRLHSAFPLSIENKEPQLQCTLRLQCCIRLRTAVSEPSYIHCETARLAPSCIL